ncbi:uracil-DNA glycosylase [Collinsella sp. zg1085]|uniref:uracil-DNA glycosylase n=1 Tax=Collinsella sp. zg1085 TaxID=2844380 RepID=UPI001C0D6860|nr:uracil-DNA glycosylase [Collinsella sp. zg1085]QWT17711.1 uracil-DNA glycosylase [Collinsella sp. zg1085]
MASLLIPGYEQVKPRELSLAFIRELVGDCKQCELCQTRTHIVFGEGNPKARVMIIGEAPGKNEDEQGLPFVGRAGKNLSRVLELAGLKRDEIYIANVLKCRPPDNRNPKAAEMLACTPYLREQIRSIWPDVVVTLGNPATHFILKTEIGITKLRGSFHQAGHFVVMPTLHPAAALRNPAWQRLLEDDMRMLGRYLANHAPQDITALEQAQQQDASGAFDDLSQAIPVMEETHDISFSE